MKLRCIPLLLQHYKRYQTPPELFALGFAAYIFFMKPVKETDGKFYGQLNGVTYPIQDDFAAVFMQRWQTLKPKEVVKEVLKDGAFWGEPLDILPGFENSVIEKLNLLINSGAKNAVELVQSKREVEV